MPVLTVLLSLLVTVPFGTFLGSSIFNGISVASALKLEPVSLYLLLPKTKAGSNFLFPPSPRAETQGIGNREVRVLPGSDPVLWAWPVDWQPETFSK